MGSNFAHTSYTSIMPSTKLQQFTVHFDNSEEFHTLKNEIFTHDLYYFETDSPTPRIIDAGAHIGLATLYFKKVYPQAHITAIEPNPDNVKLLEQNIWENALEQVEVMPVALATRTGQHAFYRDLSPARWFSTGGFRPGAWNRTQQSEETTVTARPLAAFLTQSVDLLKMDIEGAEQEILVSARDYLHLVKQLLVEFHPGMGQNLEDLVKFLQDQGFTVVVWKDGNEVKPKHARGLVLIDATHQ